MIVSATRPVHQGNDGLKGAFEVKTTKLTRGGSMLQNRLFVIIGGIVLLILVSAANADTPQCHIVSMVLVETDKQAYQQGEEVTVTATNNLDTSITTFDQQAFCSIFRLEQTTTEEWKEVRNCFSGAPRRLLTLGPHSKTTVNLPSPSPGSYRLSLVFSLGEVFDFGRTHFSYSPQFTVR